MNQILIGALALLGFCPASEGGKIQWREGKEIDAAFAEAKMTGQPILLFFTTSWCHYCKELSKGALSNDDCVKAAEPFIRVLVDGDKYKELGKKYGITGFPTMLFLDPTGKEVGKLGGREAAEVKSQFEAMAEKYTRAPSWMEADKALEAGKADGKPVLMVFTDDRAKSAMLLRVFGDEALAELYEKVAFAKVPFKKDSDLCKVWKVTDAPKMLLVDPTGDEPKLLKVVTAVKGKELKKEFEEAIKKMAKK